MRQRHPADEKPVRVLDLYGRYDATTLLRRCRLLSCSSHYPRNTVPVQAGVGKGSGEPAGGRQPAGGRVVAFDYGRQVAAFDSAGLASTSPSGHDVQHSQQADDSVEGP